MNAGSGSGILRLRREIPLLFGKKSSQPGFVSIHLFQNRLLNGRAASV
jgi:hypothetical protein